MQGGGFKGRNSSGGYSHSGSAEQQKRSGYPKVENLEATFPTRRNLYNRDFPHFKEPEVCGCFSLNGTEREFEASTRQLKYYKGDKNVQNMNLNSGLSRAIHKDEDKNKTENIINILKWIKSKKDLHGVVPAEVSTATFICYRGLLTMIMNTPYEGREDWSIYATKHNKIIYLCIKETDRKKIDRKSMTQKQLDFCSWGYKFEQYMMADHPNSAPNPSVPVQENEEFCCMFRTQLNSHNLLYGAEIDGVRSSVVMNEEDILAKGSYKKLVELKTSREVTAPNQERSYKKFKLLKWWMQSFLVGIPTVICGFRDDNGFIQEVREIKVFDMPKIATKEFWTPNVCMNFLDNFLTFVKSVVTEENRHMVYQFYWQPHSDITVQKVFIDRNFILRDWYMSCVKENE